MACDVLVLGAFHPELAPLHPILGDDLRGRIGAAAVVARITGIGLPMAAVGAAMQLAEHAPRLAVLVGTCGAYPNLPQGGLCLGNVVVPARLRLTSPCVADRTSQIPDPMSVEIVTHAPTREGLLRAGGLPGDVATTLGITVDDAAARRLARAACASAEHLEAYGVATACAARGVPLAVALGVANYVGAGAREEWRVHHRAAASAAVVVVMRWLQSGPPP